MLRVLFVSVACVACVVCVCACARVCVCVCACAHLCVNEARCTVVYTCFNSDWRSRVEHSQRTRLHIVASSFVTALL